MGRRFAILENMVDSLKLIKKDDEVQKFGGEGTHQYSHTPGEVSLDFDEWAHVRYFPAIFVNSQAQSFEGNPGRYYKSTWDILVTIYVKNNEDLEEILSDVIDDVVVALHQDVKRGGNAVATYLSRAEIESRFRPYGMAELTFTVTYHFGV